MTGFLHHTSVFDIIVSPQVCEKCCNFINLRDQANKFLADNLTKKYNIEAADDSTNDNQPSTAAGEKLLACMSEPF